MPWVMRLPLVLFYGVSRFDYRVGPWSTRRNYGCHGSRRILLTTDSDVINFANGRLVRTE